MKMYWEQKIPNQQYDDCMAEDFSPSCGHQMEILALWDHNH